MKNIIMIDLETTGTKPGCRVLTLGAFGFDKNGEQCEFYVRMNPRLMDDTMFSDDTSTIEWWGKQPESARDEAFGGKTDPKAAIAEFKLWFLQHFDTASQTNKFEAWSCGIDFDFPILRQFMENYGFGMLWNFWQQNDYRTIKNCFPGVKMFEHNGAKHTALEDSKAQMRGLRAFKNREYA